MWKKSDKNLLITIIYLLIFGWIVCFSASLGHFNSYSYAIKQLAFIIIGLTLGFFVLNQSIATFQKYSTILFVLTTICLVLVLVPKIGHTVNGSTRWIDLIYFKLQPSEFMKLAIIFFMANFLIKNKKDLEKPWLILMKSVSIISVPVILLLFETDIGSIIIITFTALSIVFAAGAYLKQLFISLFAIVIIIIISIFFVPNRWERIISFWQTDLWINESSKVYQTKQALIGIARGDISGTGLGAGIQKYSKLPEPHTDMIFAIIGEELGIIGMLSVIFAFLYIITKGFAIAAQALKNNRKYSFYVAFGICIWMTMQIDINIAMNIGLIPPKGFTLPLISYGGNSMIFAILTFAILLRIDIENKTEYSKQKQYV